MRNSKPLARRAGLVVREIPGEVLAYDLDRDKAFCLNRTAALVWKHCDGDASPADLSRILEREIGGTIDDKVVWCALDQLGRHQLLERSIPTPASLSGMTRRQQLRALAKVAAVAAPLVTAVVAPRAAEAASCKRSGMPCSSGVQCCSGLCPSATCT